MMIMQRLLFETFNFTATSTFNVVVDPSSVALSPINNVTAVATAAVAASASADTDTSPDKNSGTLLGVAIGLLVLACMCWMLKPRPVDVESSWLRRVARAQEPEESPEERQKRIKAALAVQVVTATDADGNLRLGPEDMSLSKPTDDASGVLQVLSSRSTTQPPTTAATGDEEDLNACCCICLEPYDVGEEVAWNKRQLDRCQHVFHKDCILGWLERHNDCPSCRVPIVVEADKEMEDDSDNNPAFAIVHGLLSRVVKTFKPKSKNKSKLEKPEIFRRVTSLGTCQTWERLPSQDSGDGMCCTTRAQMIRRVVSDGLSTPTRSTRECFNLESDGEDSECDVELGHLQVLRHSVSWKRDVLEKMDHNDEDVSEEDDIVFKIL